MSYISNVDDVYLLLIGRFSVIIKKLYYRMGTHTSCRASVAADDDNSIVPCQAKARPKSLVLF